MFLQFYVKTKIMREIVEQKKKVRWRAQKKRRRRVIMKIFSQVSYYFLHCRGNSSNRYNHFRKYFYEIGKIFKLSLLKTLGRRCCYVILIF